MDTPTLLILIVLAVGVALIIWMITRKKSDASSSPAAAVAAKEPPGENTWRGRTKLYTDTAKLNVGRYVTGHPALTEPQKDVVALIRDGTLMIVPILHTTPVARIPLAAVEDVAVEDRSTMESRVTATRLLTVGVFAFAAKKRERQEDWYVTVTWREGKFSNDTIFEFEGKKGAAESNALASAIKRAVNVLEQPAG